MENLMGPREAAAAATSGATGYPRFMLTEDEAQRIFDACTRAGITGPVMAKVETLLNYAAAKERFTARAAIVKME